MPVLEVLHLVRSQLPDAEAFFSHHPARHGVALFIHPLLVPFCAAIPAPPMEGTLVGTLVSLPHEPPFKLWCLYSPGRDEIRLLQSAFLEPQFKEHVILMGDLNHILSPSLDSHNLTHCANWPWLRHMILTHKLLDVVRLRSPMTPLHTRFGVDKSSRLDYVLFSAPLRHQVGRVHTLSLPKSFSDHVPIELHLPVSPFSPPQRKAHSTIRPSMLNDLKIKELHRQLCEETKKLQALYPRMYQMSLGDLADVTSQVLGAASNALRTILGQHRGNIKPNSAEKQLSKLLMAYAAGDQAAKDLLLPECHRLAASIREGKLEAANKRVHRSLVRGDGLKKALLAYDRVYPPPWP